MTHPLCNFSGELVGSIEVVAIKLDIHGGLSTHTALSGGHRKGVDFNMFTHDITDAIGNFRDEFVTLGLLHQTDVEGEQVSTVFAHQAPGVVLIGHTHRIVDSFDFVRILFVNFPYQLVTEGLGSLHARTLRQLHRRTQAGAILRGEKLGGDNLQQQQTGNEDGDGAKHNRFAVVDTPTKQTSVTVVESLQKSLYRFINFGE